MIFKWNRWAKYFLEYFYLKINIPIKVENLLLYLLLSNEIAFNEKFPFLTKIILVLYFVPLFQSSPYKSHNWVEYLMNKSMIELVLRNIF